jgi:hypothetical protein
MFSSSNRSTEAKVMVPFSLESKGWLLSDLQPKSFAWNSVRETRLREIVWNGSRNCARLIGVGQWDPNDVHGNKNESKPHCQWFDGRSIS